MINNSTLDRWKRLESKSLDQQFTNEIIHGLNCSPFEASAVLDTIYKVYSNYFETATPLKPGQIRLQLVAVEAKVSQSLSESKQVTVVLTLNDDKEDLEIRKKDGIVALRRHKIQRICREAFDQGGLLTVEDLAYRIFNCGVRTICRDLDYFRKQDIFIPLRSTVKDVGRTLSHRLLIIKLWAQGKEYSEIAKNTCHSLPAIQNYVDKFKRTITLSKEGYDVNRIAFLLRLSGSLVEQYIDIYNKLDFVQHREQELNSFFKKKSITSDQEDKI
ncbi:MAG: DUF1670 domain-containing protein [Candidatus Aminicenantia bacterium]